MKLDVTWNEVTLEIEGTFEAGYPAPYSSGDHDSSAFSDPGEPHSFSIDKIMWDDKDVTELLNGDVGDGIEELCIDVCIADSADDDRERGED